MHSTAADSAAKAAHLQQQATAQTLFLAQTQVPLADQHDD